nr:hypothetical protein [Tanacetum cinerariifolium]
MSWYNHPGCSCCGGPFNGGNCPSCSSVGSGNEFVYDQNPYSYNETLNFYNQPPQHQYETNSCEFCENDAHYGHDCPPQDPCYNQNVDYFPQNSLSFPQQYLCCDNCGGPHETFQCQPMNKNFYNSNSFGFDQFQPPHYSVIHQPPQEETSVEILQDQENEESSVENFVPIPSESEDISDSMCDVHFCENSHPLDALKDQSEIFFDPNDDSASSDDDPLYSEDIDYVDASPPDSEHVSLEEVKDYDPEDGEIDTNILLTIKDDILYEKLLNIDLLIAKIEALKENPTPSTDYVLKSGNPTSHSDLSLLDYEAFFCDSEPDSRDFTMDVVEDIFDNLTREPRVHVPNVLPTHITFHRNPDFTLSSNSLGSDLVVSFPSGTRNKIFDPGIFFEVQSKNFLSRDTFYISFIHDHLCPVMRLCFYFRPEMKNKFSILGLKLKKCSREADLSKDTSSPKPSLELQRSWCVEGHVRGSSSEVMYEHCFRNLSVETRAKQEPRTPLVGFSRKVSYLIGTINLNVTIEEPERLQTMLMESAVVKSHSPYNVILRRAGEPDDTIQPPPSPPKKDTQTCEKVEGKVKHLEWPFESKPPEKVVIHEDHPNQTITIEGNLFVKCRSELIKILQKHADAFAWTLEDMTGIPRFITEHELKTYPHIEPRVQRKRSITQDRRRVVKDEVSEWLKAGIVRKYKCFLDAYKGYHQIQMTKKDEEKMAFHTDERVFCYTKMPFGLKNAGATYQKLVDTIFEGQMGRNLEAYVDDMVIKSKTEPDMIKDIKETLLTLKKVNMKLNPKKCSFRMEEGKFLGYIFTFKGIRANPKKAKAVVNMPSSSNLKQMQRLSGKLAALNKFLSKAAEKALPCLDTLKKCTNKKDFHWRIDVEEAFQEIKRLINRATNLNDPKEGRRTHGLPISGQRSSQRCSISGKTYKMAEDISIQVKASGSNDTLTEGKSKEEQEASEIKTPENSGTETDIWKLYTKEASNEHKSWVGLILIDPEGAECSYTLRLNFAKSNNDAKYEALLAGLRIAAKINVEKMHAFVVSKLVASQVEGSYEAKSEKTKKYKEKALEMICSFNNFEISHIPREDNKKADALSKLASVQCEGLTKGVLIEELNERSMDMVEVNEIIEEATRT